MSIEDPNAFQPGPPVKPGIGTAAKVLIILGCLVGLGALVCCGGFSFLGYKMKDAITMDPVKIRERTQSMMEINVPEVLQPDRSLSFMQFGQLADYSAKGEKAFGTLILGQISRTIADNENTARAQLNPQVEQQMLQVAGSRRAGRGVPIRHDLKTVTIQGTAVPFEITEYPGASGGPGTIKVSGFFAGKNGYCELLLEASRNLLSDQQINEMLESIK